MQNRQTKDIGAFFSRFAADWDNFYGRKKNSIFRALDQAFRSDIIERYELTFDALGPNLRGKSVLDIGCGSGIYGIEAAKRGASYVLGIDIAPPMVNLARLKALEQGQSSICSFICAEFPLQRLIPELNQKFDYAILMGVMDYTADPIRLLGAVKDCVQDFAVISFPYRHWLRFPLRKYRYKLMGRCDVYHYHEDEVRGLCEKAGFSRVDMRFLPSSSGWIFTTVYV